MPRSSTSRRIPKLLSLLQSACGQAGLLLLPAWRLPRLPQAEYLQRVFREWDITSVIDVGANEGQYRDFIRQEVDFSGAILSVEPLPDLARRLRERTEHDQLWKVEELALGAQSGTAQFYVTSSSQFSSLLRPLGTFGMQFNSQDTVTAVVDVVVDTLDRLIGKYSDFLGDRIYLKLDTQGNDLRVLDGLLVQRPNVLALQTEASVKAIYAGMPAYQETIQAIQSIGYSVSQFFPNNDGHFPLLFEFDCHFVRLSDRHT